ncbi:MAG: AGE family epimerase/isomerase [Kiloniellaceae bacterium]
MPQPPEDFPAPRLRPWLRDILLPFWATRGFDSRHGAFVEKFEASGEPSDDDYTRVRVQARQIFVFSHAARCGLGGPGLGGLERARSAFAFLEAHAWDREEGGWFHRLRRSGPPLDRRKDCYDHAFLLLAMAALYRAGGDAAVLERAAETAGFLDRALRRRRGDAFDGYAEHAVPAGAAVPLPRRQNPHMHLLEAFLALYEASGDPSWRDRAAGILDLFHRRFLQDGQLAEFFDRDWREVPQQGRRLREPGHFFEWTWLLQRHATLCGDDTAASAMRPLYDWAWHKGVDRAGGAPWVAFEELDAEGRVLADGRKRLWPQSEAVKAALAVYERFGDEEALNAAGKLLGGLFTTFAGLDRPDWREQTDRDGRTIRAGMPASSLYHLYLATAEAVRVLEGG